MRIFTVARPGISFSLFHTFLGASLDGERGLIGMDGSFVDKKCRTVFGGLHLFACFGLISKS